MRPMATVLSMMLSLDVLAGCEVPPVVDGVSAGPPAQFTPAALPDANAQAEASPEAEPAVAVRVRHPVHHRRVKHRHASPR